MPAASKAIKVHQSINNIIKAFGSKPIEKDKTNSFQRYQYRGIEDVLLALNPLLVEHKLNIIPRVTDRETILGTTKKGENQYSTRLTIDYEIVHIEDGSSVVATLTGEASDTSDKSHNKAMSNAYKYMAFQVFCIPTEGAQNDIEETSPEVASQPAPVQQQQQQTSPTTSNEGLQQACRDWLDSIKDVHKVVVTPAMATTLAFQKHGNKELQTIVNYLGDLSMRLSTNNINDNERKMLNL